MHSPENYIAIVKLPLDNTSTALHLEPTESGEIEIAKEYKRKLCEMEIPVISFGADNIHKTIEELKSKGVVFKKELEKTDYGYEAIFDDANGNYIQLLQLD